VTDATADERALIEAAQRDPSRFAEIYESHFERVYAYVLRRLRDRTEAEDVTSEVFQQALGALPRFEWRGAPLGAWLIRIAANAVADRFERRARERGAPLPEAALEPPAVEIEDQARLFRLVRRLPEDQRRVILLRFVEQRPIREVAAALGRSEGAVKQLQLRGIENLRKWMGRDA
jgi:RNA polymerase sigma-70 factor, ECF subfamily